MRTIAALLTMIAALLTVLVVVQLSKPAQAGGVAGVGGDPCPSDINNDAMVDVLDFLQVLGDWGPCPSNKVISMTEAIVICALSSSSSLRSPSSLPGVESMSVSLAAET